MSISKMKIMILKSMIFAIAELQDYLIGLVAKEVHQDSISIRPCIRSILRDRRSERPWSKKVM